MRFMILLVFGGMGGLVMWLGWVRYQAVTNQVRASPQVGGVIRQVTGDGYVVEYQVAGESYQAPAGRWLGWPKVKEGDQVRVVHDPQSPGAGKVDAWQEIYQEALVIAFCGSIGLFLGIGGFFSLGDNLRKMEEASGQTPVATETARAPLMSLGEVVELRHPASSVWMMGIGAVIAFAVSVGLYRAPDILLGRFLAWPVAAGAFVIGVLILLAAYDHKHTILRADMNGLHETSRWSSKEAAWTQVAKIVRLRRTVREYSETNRRYRTRTAGFTWVLSDRNGAELIKIDEAMEPAEALNRLLRYIPTRTGVAVEEKKE